MQKRLYRSRKSRVIGGVAGGLGDYLSIDPVIVRVIFLLMLFFSGFGFLTYIILWIVVPEEPYYYKNAHQTPPASETSSEASSENYPDNEFESANNSQDDFSPNQDYSAEQNYGTEKNYYKEKSNTGNIVFGSILIGVGALFLLKNYFFRFDFSDLIPIVFVILGLVLLLNSNNKKNKQGE